MTLDVGVIGVGNMGKNHARVYSEMKDVDDLYLYDTNKTLLHETAREFDAEECSDILELLHYVEAVSVCVPTPIHHNVAMTTVERAIHTLIEKPICSTMGLADELIKTIPNGVVVGVGHIERFNPVVSEIIRIIREPLYIEIKRHNPNSTRITDTNVVDDLMIHDIDLIYNELYPEIPPDFVAAIGDEDIAIAIFSYLDATPICLSSSRKASRRTRCIYIEEEEYTIIGDLSKQEVSVYWKPEVAKFEHGKYTQESTVEHVTINKVEPLKEELQTFVQCIIRELPFPVTPSQARNNLDVCRRVNDAL